MHHRIPQYALRGSRSSVHWLLRCPPVVSLHSRRVDTAAFSPRVCRHRRSPPSRNDQHLCAVGQPSRAPKGNATDVRRCPNGSGAIGFKNFPGPNETVGCGAAIACGDAVVFAGVVASGKFSAALVLLCGKYAFALDQCGWRLAHLTVLCGDFRDVGLAGAASGSRSSLFGFLLGVWVVHR